MITYLVARSNYYCVHRWIDEFGSSVTLSSTAAILASVHTILARDDADGKVVSSEFGAKFINKLTDGLLSWVPMNAKNGTQLLRFTNRAIAFEENLYNFVIMLYWIKISKWLQLDVQMTLIHIEKKTPFIICNTGFPFGNSFCIA